VAAFSTDVKRVGDTTYIALTGELDIAAVPELRELAHAELNAPNCHALVFELGELSFVDSTGVGCLVETHQYAAARDQQVTIRNPAPRVRRVLEIGGMLKLFGAD
jgi:anti-anti-sigma factor